MPTPSEKIAEKERELASAKKELEKIDTRTCEQVTEFIATINREIVQVKKGMNEKWWVPCGQWAPCFGIFTPHQTNGRAEIAKKEASIAAMKELHSHCFKPSV